MSHYARTPHMVNPMLAPQPVAYAPSHGTPYYNHTPNGLGRRQSLGAYMPSQPAVYHLTSSEPSHSRSHHRSSSKSRTHRRSHSVDRHGGGRHRRHHHRSSTPVPARYSSDAHYAVSRSLLTASSENADLIRNSFQTPSRRRHSTAVSSHHHLSSSRDPHRVGHHGHHGHHYVTHHRESIGDRIKRFFGITPHRTQYVDSSGYPVDRLGRPLYAT